MNVRPTARLTWTQFLFRRRTAIVVVALILSILAAWRTALTYANLRSDLEELLPESAPSVTALTVLRSRLPGLRHLGVVIDTGGPHNLKQAERFVNDLTQRLRQYPKQMVSAVQTDNQKEQSFIETYALQLMAPDDVQTLRKAVEARRDWEVSKETGALLDDDDSEQAPDIPWDSIARKYKNRYGITDDTQSGRFVSKDGNTMVIVLQVASSATGYEDDQRLIERVKADVASLDFPRAYGGTMRLGLTGDVAARVEETTGLEADLGVSTLVVILLVAGVVIGYYRSFKALAVLGLPLACGTFCTFGFVALPPLRILTLNTNTAFLGSIVVGNGINSSIILLARYQEERLKGRSPSDAIQVAMSTTWKPTLAASGAAAVAYASLIATAFRGFNQFGWIGGFGMMICWAVNYTLVPILARDWDPMPWRRTGVSAQTQPSFGTRWTVRAVGAPVLVVSFWTLAVVLGLFGIWHRRGTWVEYDLSQLRRRDSPVHGDQYWGAKMDATLGRYLTPTVVMASSADAAAGVRKQLEEVRRQGKAADLIASVRTANDVFPAHREQSLAEAKQLKAALTPAILASLSDEDRPRVEHAVSAAALTPLALESVPDLFLAGLREFDGRVDRNVLLFPKLTAATWDGNAIIRFSKDVREASTYDGERAVVAGSLLLSADIASAMRADGPLATALSLFVVLVICMLAFGSLPMSINAIVSMFIGVAVMLGALAWCGAKLNFSNFIAMPITFGIAADYSINLLRRFVSEGNPDPRGAVMGSGGAVALCSATTIIGYSSLLMAQNRALFSFGVMAVAGEIACLSTAVVLLPAALLWVHRQRQRRNSARPL